MLMWSLAGANSAGKSDWAVSIDATIAQAHRPATNTTRPAQNTESGIESQEPAAAGD